jgi:hypothetical protein
MYQGYKQFADGLAKTKYSMYAIFLWQCGACFNFMLIWGFSKIRESSRSRNGFVQNNDGGFMHYLKKCRLEKIF